MSQPNEKTIFETLKQKRISDFVIGFLGWLILNSILLNLRYIVHNPVGLLLDLTPLIILGILFAKKKYWVGFGVIVAIIVRSVPYLIYYYIGD